MSVSDLIHWDRPFNVPVRQNNRFGRSLMSLQDDMNRLMQDFLGEDRFASNWPPTIQGERFPSIDVIENEKGFKIRAELPGMDPENVDISVSEGYLSLKGERTEEKEEKDDNYLRHELSYGSFQRTIALPDTANCDKADASFKNGILTIDVPKKEGAAKKPKKLRIKKAA